MLARDVEVFVEMAQCCDDVAGKIERFSLDGSSWPLDRYARFRPSFSEPHWRSLYLTLKSLSESFRYSMASGQRDAWQGCIRCQDAVFSTKAFSPGVRPTGDSSTTTALKIDLVLEPRLTEPRLGPCLLSVRTFNVPVLESMPTCIVGRTVRQSREMRPLAQSPCRSPAGGISRSKVPQGPTALPTPAIRGPSPVEKHLPRGTPCRPQGVCSFHLAVEPIPCQRTQRRARKTEGGLHEVFHRYR